MHLAISAIKQLLETSKNVEWSLLSDIKKIYYGDPVVIDESSFPAIAIRPAQTAISHRGTNLDNRVYAIEICLVYNAKMYFDKNIGGATSISAATYDGDTKKITYTSTGHWLQVGQPVIVSGCSPVWYNGTFYVLSKDTDHFTVTRATPPGAFVSGWSVAKAYNDTVFAVQDAIRKVEWLADPETALSSICWVIQHNVLLPFTDAEGKTTNAAVTSSVDNVTYNFNETRGFPTYEVVISMRVQTVVDR